MQVQNFHANAASFSAKHHGQYHGAGVFTGLGLRFRHLAQRYLLPFTAVLGRYRLPVFGMLFMGLLTSRHYSGQAASRAIMPAESVAPRTISITRHPRVVLL